MAKIFKKYNTVGWFGISMDHDQEEVEKTPGSEIRKKITFMLETMSDEQLASHMAENWSDETIDILNQSDHDYCVFTDKFYDFLESNGVDAIDSDHPKWNEICEMRNYVFDLINREINDG